MFHPEGPTFWELAHQALSSTRHGYDLLAPKFDFTPFRTPDDVVAAAISTLGGPLSVDSALDVCCGTGAGMRGLRPLCRDRVVGIDFSKSMLMTGRKHTADAAGRARLEWVQANVLEMPFEAEFDVATCFGALGHIRRRDESRFVAQISRALKPGGRFVFASAFLPPKMSWNYWLSRGFNAAMHVRNLLVRPPFIMFYLTFLVPEVQGLLEDHNFAVEVHQGLFAEPYTDHCLVVATLRD
jgi:ubiquinone/menaquinone biosynthesis C-methylase UbiE